MKPLRVWCDLAEPVIYYGDGMAFDGILTAAVMRDLPYAVTSKWPTATRDEPWVRDLDLPLAKWAVRHERPCEPRLRDDRGNVWGWHASAVHAVWHAMTTVEVRKRAPVDELKRWSDASDINISAGRFKAHDLKLPARLASRLEWYVIGDERKITKLLTEHITAVGRKVCQGNGRVLRWRVEEWPHDWSVLRNGRLTRAMPAGFMRGPIGRRAIRAPSWHPSRLVECVLPAEHDLVPGEP